MTMDHEPPTSARCEPFDQIDPDDLDMVENWLLNEAPKNAPFFPKDAHTLTNLTLHMTREVRQARADLAAERGRLDWALKHNAGAHRWADSLRLSWQDEQLRPACTDIAVDEDPRTTIDELMTGSK